MKKLKLPYRQAETSCRTVRTFGWLVTFESGQVRYCISVLSVRGSGPSGGFTASSVHCLPWIGCSQIEGSGRLVGHGVLQVSVTTGLPPEKPRQCGPVRLSVQCSPCLISSVVRLTSLLSVIFRKSGCFKHVLQLFRA